MKVNPFIEPSKSMLCNWYQGSFSFESLDEILKRDQSDESYWPGRSNFWSADEILCVTT